MKYIASILTVVLLSCAGYQPPGDTQTKANVILLQSQVQQLQTTVDSLIQVLRPKPKSISKKPKSKTHSTSVQQLSKKDDLNNYEFQTNNSTTTPLIKSTKQDNVYRIRVGAICNDGSRSYATGRGACSHHGGVREWLYQ